MVTRSVEELKEEIIRLGPWHQDIEVMPGLSTSAFLEAPEGTYDDDARRVTFNRHHDRWIQFMTRIYPEELNGRSLLDCACNSGAYCFWAKELGAAETFGFDVREHWINQARFLLEHRALPVDRMRFEVLDLYELPELGLEPFDVTVFKGIFYHLPDPISGLKIAADLTKEVLIVDSAYRNDLPDGMLAIGKESRSAVMSGVHGLNWFPTGPEVMTRILTWLGFEHIKVTGWRAAREGRQSTLGRLSFVASRVPGRLERLASVDAPT